MIPMHCIYKCMLFHHAFSCHVNCMHGVSVNVSSSTELFSQQ